MNHPIEKILEKYQEYLPKLGMHLSWDKDGEVFFLKVKDLLPSSFTINNAPYYSHTSSRFFICDQDLDELTSDIGVMIHFLLKGRIFGRKGNIETKKP